MTAFEANFDGLIGPTHNYGGLSDGNLASAANAGLVASPRQAALQGLEKMRLMHESGLRQGILPPHKRPFMPLLRQAGFSGSDQDVYVRGWKSAPVLMKNALSASAMWAANAATVSPSADCADGKLHLTPANLSTMLHRSVEHGQTMRALQKAFPFAIIHPALPTQSAFSDEGAANHVRLCASRENQGVELFVYGRTAFEAPRPGFPARQTREACEAVARNHQLDTNRVVMTRQSDEAIDAGSFHNDVVCVGALNTLFYHELAFADTNGLQRDIKRAAAGLFEPIFVEVSNKEVPIKDAIKAYLFNSMLVKRPKDARLTLIAPLETRENEKTREYCDRLMASNGPIGQVQFVDVRQSMRNGGGPACLRLRVTLTEQEWTQTNPGNRFSAALYERLGEWITRHYREALSPEDLTDPALMDESFKALYELSDIMDLGENFYDFD